MNIKNIFLLFFIFSCSPIQAEENYKDFPPMDFEKVLNEEREYEFWQYSSHTDDNGCLASRQTFLAKNKLKLSKELPEDFSAAIRHYEDEYTLARVTNFIIQRAQNIIRIDKKHKAGKELSQKDLRLLERYKRHSDWFNEYKFCAEKTKPYTDKTKSLLLQSAKKGYEPAIIALSVVYKNGIGTEVDLIEAYAWRGVSVALHRPFGQDKLDSLAAQLDPFELNKAEGLSFQYQKKYTKLFDAPTGVIWNK